MEIEKHNFDQECGVFKDDTLGYFYSCTDIDPLLEELETLRASNRIKQANIELLEAEIVHLKTELLCITHDRDALLAERDRYKLIVLNTMRQKAVGEVTEDNGALGAVFYKDAEMQLGDTIYAKPASSLSLEDKIQRLEAENAKLIAEREAMMKQEPYGYVNPKDEWNLRNKGYAQIQPKMTDYSTMPLFRSPLPAQQIPEGLKDWFVRLTNCLSCYDEGEYFGKCCPQDMLDELEVMLSASQPKGDK